jgi:poly-gamma-glutamate capsule biosynthesis protein CapA/YwtB (metallophosphatase superfamily)
MPAPITEVIWISRDDLAAGDKHSLGREAGDLLDGHLEASPRGDGALRARYRVSGLAQLHEELEDGRPLIVSIDLDYFAGMSANDRAAAFERIWSFVVARRNLRAVTFAISRPYLSGDEEADALVQLALAASLSLPTAHVQFEPFRTVGNDQSLRAREYRAKGGPVPAYDVTKASASLRASLLAARDQLTVRHDAARWKQLLATWASEAPSVRISVKDHQPSTDGIRRVAADARSEIELHTVPWYTPPDGVEWIIQRPAFARCNLVATRGDEPGFAEGAPPRPRWDETVLPALGRALPLDQLREFFDPQTGCGAVRIKARARFGPTVRETAVMELRRSTETGFRGALLEQFGLPYLFGSGQLRGGGEAGPETGWGADCANFLVHALRRQGHRIPWSDPKQLRKYLQVIAEDVPLRSGAVIASQDIEEGVFIHLDTHVAAMMEDRPPIGVLNAQDIVAHQLEGTPELIELGRLLERRRRTTFDLLRVPVAPERADVLIGGDVMLGRTVGTRVQHGEDPFGGVTELLRRPGLKLANLECVVSSERTPAPGKRYPLRAPVEAAAALASAGFNAVGLANNHALDFGPAALVDSVRRLRAANVTVIGAGETAAEAYAPHVLTTADGTRVAVLAINDIEPAANDPGATVAASSNRSALRNAITDAKERADVLLALVHWGEENTAIVTERQRTFARWLVNAGVDVIAGAHPHHVQAWDHYRGRPIIYSLGNLVFDGAPTVPGWNRGNLVEVDLTNARSPRTRLIPVQLDERGYPRVTPQAQGRVWRALNRIRDRLDGGLQSRAAGGESVASAARACCRSAPYCTEWCRGGGRR